MALTFVYRAFCRVLQILRWLGGDRMELTEPAWDPRVFLSLETRMEREQEPDREAVSP